MPATLEREVGGVFQEGAPLVSRGTFKQLTLLQFQDRAGR